MTDEGRWEENDEDVPDEKDSDGFLIRETDAPMTSIVKCRVCGSIYEQDQLVSEEANDLPGLLKLLGEFVQSNGCPISCIPR